MSEFIRVEKGEHFRVGGECHEDGGYGTYIVFGEDVNAEPFDPFTGGRDARCSVHLTSEQGRELAKQIHSMLGRMKQASKGVPKGIALVATA